MPVYGRVNVTKSAYVEGVPELPYPLYNGTLTWSDTFDSNTSGTITYEGVPASEISSIKRAYPDNHKFTIFGFPFKVTRFGYALQKTPHVRGMVKVATVTIQLEGSLKISDEAKAIAEKVGYVSYVTGKVIKMTDEVAGWNFSDLEVIEDGPNETGPYTSGFNQAELTAIFTGQELPPSIQSFGNPEVIFVPRTPEYKTLVESSENPTEPPSNTKFFWSTKDNADESGEKKTWRETTLLNGKPVLDRSILYGFKYLKEDIQNTDGTPKEHDPANFWGEIEVRNTYYKYEGVGASALTINISRPGTGGSPVPMKFLVHPDYARYASVGLDGGTIAFQSRAEFNTEVTTRGKEYRRLLKEDGTKSTINSRNSDSYQKGFFHFKEIPLEDRTVYLLKSRQGLFGEEIQQPFTIEYRNIKDLPPSWQQRFDQQSITSDGTVAILIPDVNYVEPLYISHEAHAANSFAWAFDPEETEDVDPDAPNPVKRPKRLVTGQESFNEVQRTIISESLYSERVSEYSSQDPGFDNAIEHISFREIEGSPPEPNYRLQTIDVQPFKPNQIQVPLQNQNKKYLITTPDNASEFEPNTETIDVGEVRDLNEALSIIQVQLRKAGMEDTQRQVNVAWFYPNIRAGHICTAGTDYLQASGGKWRVKQVNWTLEYKGMNTDRGLLCTSSGTRLTLGLDDKRTIDVEEKLEPAPTDKSRDQEPTIDVSVAVTPGAIGALLPGVATRRNY